jgi:hypothetical protein
MPISLKKWTPPGAGDSAEGFFTDNNANLTAIETAVNQLEANASLLWEGTGTQTVFDVIVANYSSLPNNCMRQVLVKSGSGTIHGTVVFKASNTHGKVIMLSFLDTNLVVYQLRNGTWTESIK